MLVHTCATGFLWGWKGFALRVLLQKNPPKRCLMRHEAKYVALTASSCRSMHVHQLFLISLSIRTSVNFRNIVIQNFLEIPQIFHHVMKIISEIHLCLEAFHRGSPGWAREVGARILGDAPGEWQNTRVGLLEIPFESSINTSDFLHLTSGG